MITLVLGGARSGKSEVAESLAAGLPAPVTYVATAEVTDPDMAERVEVHRARRPGSWTTVEVGAERGLLDVLGELTGTVVLDSLGTWVASFEGFAVDAEALARRLVERDGDTVVVSEEVGLGVHPGSEAGRAFRDALGVVNRRVAAVSDEALLVVAGRVLRLDEAPDA